MAVEMVKCPFCESEISATAKVCPNCARDLRKAKGGYKTGTAIMAFGLLAVLLGILTDPTVLVLGLAIMGFGALVRITTK